VDSAERVMIIVGTPAEAVEQILDAIAAAGGGVIGQYTHCAFTISGLGHFRPAEQADPHIGLIGHINRVDEVRIETFCDRRQARAVAQAIRQAHPYEEPVIYIIPLLSEDRL
jgi:hypothetical protein